MKPLEGIKVIEFSTMITASFAAMMMAEQGASVTKVEPIELGDPMRFLGSNKGGISALFANFNRGKKSLRLDIKEEKGKEVIRKLVKDADVILCNFRPGIMDKLGLGSDALRKDNPRLIYAAITGFGTEGPEKNRPAYDPIIQAQAGFAAVQGQGKEGPELVRNLVCDKITAYTAFQAVTAALYVREKTGEGQHIDLSMMDAGLFFVFGDGFMHETLLDEDAEELPPLSQLLYDLTETKDGGITMSAANSAQQIGLFTALDQLHLLADERFNSQEKLVAHYEELKEILRDKFLEFETDEILKRLSDNDVPAAKCLGYQDVFDHVQYEANETVDIVDHPILGKMKQVKMSTKFEGKRLEPSHGCPAHGEHTAELLNSLGYSKTEIDELFELKVAQ